MRSAEVLVSDLSSRGKKCFRKGDTCYEYNFHNGSFDKLIQGGFLKETTAVLVEGNPDAMPGEKLEESTEVEISENLESAEVESKEVDENNTSEVKEEATEVEEKSENKSSKKKR